MATGQPSTLAPFIMMRLVGMVLAVAWSAPTPRPPPAKGVLVQPTMQYLTLSHHYITGCYSDCAAPAAELEQLEAVPGEVEAAHGVVHNIHRLHGLLHVLDEAGAGGAVVVAPQHAARAQTLRLHHVQLGEEYQDLERVYCLPSPPWCPPRPRSRYPRPARSTAARRPGPWRPWLRAPALSRPSSLRRSEPFDGMK